MGGGCGSTNRSGYDYDAGERPTTTRRSKHTNGGQNLINLLLAKLLAVLDLDHFLKKRAVTGLSNESLNACSLRYLLLIRVYLLSIGMYNNSLAEDVKFY